MTMKATILTPLLAIFLVCTFVSAADHPDYEGFSAPAYFTAQGSIIVTDTAVHKIGWYSANGAAWQPLTLQGSSYGTNNEWLAGTAIANLPASLAGPGEHYVIVYSCSWNGAWDCHGGKWQLRIIDNQSPLLEGTIYLVQGGFPQADIIVAPDAPNMVKLAAEYFQDDIQAMAGATLPINNNPDPAYDLHVYIGRSEHTDSLGITAEGCEHGGYKMVSGEDYLVLLGQDDPRNTARTYTSQEWNALLPSDVSWVNSHNYGNAYNSQRGIYEFDGRGSMNAVHAFLYDQGMRWYYPSDIGIITPQKDDIVFQHQNKLVNPDFALRQGYIYYKKFGHLRPGLYPDWETKLRWTLAQGLNSPEEYITGYYVHGINGILDNEETVANHPEYYAIWGGVRMDGTTPGYGIKPDLCSQGLYEETVRYVKFLFDVHEASMVSVMPSDGFTSASESSPECKARETPERGGPGTISDYVWDFINDVAWEVHDDPAYGPEKMIIGGAYTFYQLPPLTPSDPRGFAPNLAVIITKWRSWNADEERKRQNQDVVNQWRALTDNIYTYDYYLYNRLGSTTQALPAMYPHIIAEDMQFHKGIAKGEFFEAYSNWPDYGMTWDSFSAIGLNVYVIFRMYWDASLDIEELLDEYYYLFYGPAAEEMRAAVDYSEANFMRATQDPDVILTLRELLNDARTAAGNTIYGERVDLLIDLINSNYIGPEATIDSCQKLTSPSTTYRLTMDVSSQGSCFLIDADDVTLDCQGHTITYSTSGTTTNDRGIAIIEGHPTYTNRGDYFTIKDCVIKDGSYLTGTVTGPAIYISGADYGLVMDTFINTSGDGIIGGGVSNTYRRNVVHAHNGHGFFSQYGSSQERGPISRNVFEDNHISSVTTLGAYFYRNKNDTVINNTFYSKGSVGLHLHYNENMTFIDNTFISGAVQGFRYYGPASFVVFEGNEQING